MMIFEPGEHKIGEYRVRLARFEHGEWQPHGPWLATMVTDLRLVMMAEDRDQSPMTILPRSIARVWHACIGKRDGGIIMLKTGHLFYFYVDWSQGARLVNDLEYMMGEVAVGV